MPRQRAGRIQSGFDVQERKPREERHVRAARTSGHQLAPVAGSLAVVKTRKSFEAGPSGRLRPLALAGRVKSLAKGMVEMDGLGYRATLPGPTNMDAGGSGEASISRPWRWARIQEKTGQGCVGLACPQF